jgi:hypothetical protein
MKENAGNCKLNYKLELPPKMYDNINTDRMPDPSQSPGGWGELDRAGELLLST